MLVVKCLRFYSCQTMNYLLLKFLDVNGVNMFAIYLNIVEALFCIF